MSALNFKPPAGYTPPAPTNEELLAILKPKPAGQYASTFYQRNFYRLLVALQKTKSKSLFLSSKALGVRTSTLAVQLYATRKAFIAGAWIPDASEQDSELYDELIALADRVKFSEVSGGVTVKWSPEIIQEKPEPKMTWAEVAAAPEDEAPTGESFRSFVADFVQRAEPGDTERWTHDISGDDQAWVTALLNDMEGMFLWELKSDYFRIIRDPGNK